MNKELLNVMLVDDSFAVNFFNKTVLEGSGICDKIIETRHGKEAIETLRKLIKEDAILPDIILLDLNMPVMDGWGFLRQYEKLDPELRKPISLYILTTSINPEEKHRALSNALVDDFLVKPIGKNTLKILARKKS